MNINNDESYKKNINVKINEEEADSYIKNNEYKKAEILLLKNVKEKTSSENTYHLLIKIYRARADYNNLIKIVNLAIKYSDKKKFKDLKKFIVLNKMLKDIFNI